MAAGTGGAAVDALPEAYRRLNESFDRTLYFHLGVNAGFFSEFNNMLLAILYCLDRRIKFVLYSADANFRTAKGWDDFFLPFCPETADDFHHENNYRWLKYYHPRRKLIVHLRKRRRGLDLLTHDVWRKFKNTGFAGKRFTIRELGIDGDILHATRILHSIVWRYNERTASEVGGHLAEFGLPERYIGLHVRAGDKSIEHELYPSSSYVEAAEARSPLRDAFVLTDDYSSFEELEREHPTWRFRTSCRPEERGYFHAEYQSLDSSAKAARLIRLFAAMDALALSEVFVGTFSSNPGMNMGMRMGPGRAFGVDYDSWKITW